MRDISGRAHHVIQRGEKGASLFLSDEEKNTYMGIVARCFHEEKIEIWAYCLMPDHLHLVAISDEGEAIDETLFRANRAYITWQESQQNGAIPSFTRRPARHLLDETHLIACVRYVEINPVKRDYVAAPEAWVWSSAAAHMRGEDDPLATVAPLLERVKEPWAGFLAHPISPEEAMRFYAHELSGEPMVVSPS